MARAYHEFILVPSLGHYGPGDYQVGRSYGVVNEIDVVAAVTRSIAEALENDGVKHRVEPTHKPPGRTVEERHAVPGENALRLYIVVVEMERDSEEWRRNATQVAYSRPSCTWIANALADTVTDWARCVNFHHQRANPRLDMGLSAEPALALSVFDPAGPDLDAYFRRMGDLGRTIAVLLQDCERDPRKPQTLWEKPTRPTPLTRTPDHMLVQDFLAIGDNLVTLPDPDEPRPVTTRGRKAK
jgi:hypothetical protein